MSEISIGKLLEVKVEKLSTGGSGIARHEGSVIFVPLSAPNDILEVKIVEAKKNYYRAEIVKIIQPSDQRVSPPCEYYGRCGGCNWQHVSYNEQLRQKELIVKDHLLKALKVSDLPFKPIVPCDNQLRYRNRIQLKFRDECLGYFERKSHNIIDIKDCLLAENPVSNSLSEIRNIIQKKKIKEHDRIEPILDQDGSVKIKWDSESEDVFAFSQVNRFMNSKLIESVLSKYLECNTNTFVDLYAGSGNFTFPLLKSKKGSKGVSVELSSSSVKQAHSIIQNLSLKPSAIKFYMSDVELWLQRNNIDKDSFVLLDPPRAGCSENTIRWLAQHNPSTLVYISCNPAALGRDLSRLLSFSEGKYRVKEVQSFDMFPQTDHVETLVVLES